MYISQTQVDYCSRVWNLFSFAVPARSGMLGAELSSAMAWVSASHKCPHGHQPNQWRIYSCKSSLHPVG
jgi:hypothetical protein